jgi:hypothetical protein
MADESDMPHPMGVTPLESSGVLLPTTQRNVSSDGSKLPAEAEHHTRAASMVPGGEPGYACDPQLIGENCTMVRAEQKRGHPSVVDSSTVKL